MTVPELVSGLEITVDGLPLDPAITEHLVDARVQDHLMLPDTFQLRIRDPDLALVDGGPFDVGRRVALRLAAPREKSSPVRLFQGEVATIAPEFEEGGCLFVVRGYDVSHRLNRSPSTRTFQNMTASDIATKVIGAAGLEHDVTATRTVYDFEEQSSETDWAFLWRLARRVGFELACMDGKIHFGPPGAGADPPVRLEWGVDLRAFHPRVTAIQQVKEIEVSGWDPATKRRVAASATAPQLDSHIGLDRDRVADGLGGGKLSVPDHIVASTDEASSLAQSTLDRVANAWLEAEGWADGNPKVRAGARVGIVGVGSRFGGDYLVSSATHIVRGGHGYETRFEVSGRARRSLVDLLTPPRRREYGASLVIGVVTNTRDPDGMGRVRVKFPGLDEDAEGWWARVSSVAATGGRGVMMMPLVDDEVVVGFEHGDLRRPVVLGALWNGTAKPEALASQSGGRPDGSFNVHSNEKVQLSSAKDMVLTTEQGKISHSAGADHGVEAKQAVTVKAGTEVEVEANTSISIKGNTSVTVESTGSLTLKGLRIDVQASGVLTLKGSQVLLG